MVPTPPATPGGPRPEPSFPDRPKVGGINASLRATVHRLIDNHPERSVQVIRDWMAEGAVSASYH